MSSAIRIEASVRTTHMRGVASRLTDLRPPLNQIADDLVRRAKQSFDESRTPWGTRWAPLSPVTIALKSSRSTVGRRGGRPVYRNARGRFSATLEPIIGLKPTVKKRVDRQSASVGARGIGKLVTIAIVHQFGNPKNRFPNRPGGAPAPIPARAFLPIAPNGKSTIPREQKAAYRRIIRAFLLSGRV